MLVALKPHGVFGQRFGTGSPSVLGLHGWGRNHSDFGAVFEGANAIAVDLPGFGASPPPPSPFGAGDYARHLQELLDSFDEPPVVVGHSLGGRIAVCMASMFPEKIGGLVLCGAPLLFRDERQTRKPALRYRIVRWATRKKLIKPDRLEKMKHESGSSDYRSATGVMRDSLVKIVNESYEDELRRISCPVWLVWGAKDAEVPLSIAKRARALISSQTTLLVEPEAGHLLPVTHPAILRNALAVAKGTTHDAS